MDATRQLFWNSGSPALLYIGSAVAVLVLIGGVLVNMLAWRRGRAQSPGARIPLRTALWSMLTNVGLVCDKKHMRIHRAILWGTGILLLGSAWEGANKHFGWGLLVGPPYLAFKLVLNMAGVAVLVAIGFVVHERWINRLPRLESHFWDALPIVLLGLVVLSGFVLEGMRITATRDPWWFFSPIGSIFALASLPLSASQLVAVHQGLWYGHIVIALALVALTPWTKMFHMVVMPFSIVRARPYAERGLPRPAPSAEAAEDPRDAATLGGHSRRQLIEADACIQCGRCRSWCSIHHGGLADAPVSMLDGARKLLYARAWDTPLVPATVSADGLWACTACRTCEDHCPMLGEHVVRVVDLRRAEVRRGRVPEYAAQRFAEFEAKLERPPAAVDSPAVTGDAATVHIWSGCRVADQDASILDALYQLLAEAGVTPVVLEPPACCGSPARRLGNEDLYLRSAEANIAYLRHVAPPLVVTPCPHCLVTLQQEYAELGHKINVMHHSQYLAELIASDRLALPPKRASVPAKRVVYHDPCYLARYGGDTISARTVLTSTPGVELAGLRRHTGRKAFCCGDGGGTASPDAALANGRERLAQLAESGAEVVATACPYCRDHLAAAETAVATAAAAAESPAPSMRFLDIAEILAGR
ncbi:MAG: heterodisulfide reductase-related iron-sulfur binding cluster [Coriobacteriia bacterium]